jgi:hypothetical protein
VALDDLRLECELTGLVMHESSLESHEATLTAEQKGFEDASCDRTTSEMRGLSPKIISGDSQ